MLFFVKKSTQIIGEDVEIATKLLRVKAWDADPVVQKIQGIVSYCLQEVHLRGADWPATESVVSFLKSCALCMNMFYPEQGEAKRPLLVTDGATFIFDNGISESTDHDNYPMLCISGMQLVALAPMEELGIDLKLSCGTVQFTFRGDQFRYGIGFANVKSALPSALVPDLLSLGRSA